MSSFSPSEPQGWTVTTDALVRAVELTAPPESAVDLAVSLIGCRPDELDITELIPGLHLYVRGSLPNDESPVHDNELATVLAQMPWPTSVMLHPQACRGLAAFLLTDKAAAASPLALLLRDFADRQSRT